MRRNEAFVGFGFSNIDGDILVGSSNLDLSRMPNLKQSKNSRDTFIAALKSKHMVLGKTYYLQAIDSWVIPLRKSIRDMDGKVRAVMIAGINPKLLLPNLVELSAQDTPFTAQLISDNGFLRLYISSSTNTENITKLLGKPVDLTTVERHRRDLSEQLGKTLQQLRLHKTSAEYMSTGVDGIKISTSLFYISKYQLWSTLFIPKQLMIQQMTDALIPSLIAFVAVFIVIFFLFKYIDASDRKTRQQLINQAQQDFLTGLNNRLYLNQQEPKWVGGKTASFYVYFIDLDNFKNINDSYGHTIGDAILKQVAARLEFCFGKAELICRQGGDEFIILCRSDDEERIRQTAQQALQTIGQPYSIDHYQFSIGASIGISQYPRDGQNFSELFSAADAAMYQAKETRNNYFIFTEELREQAILKAKVEQALHTALQNNEIAMVYQPQMNRLGKPYGVEALVRWTNPELGSIPPVQFIPIAEDNGQIIELGHFIIDQSLKDLTSKVVQNDKYNLQLSINISVRQLQEKGFFNYLENALRQYKFPCSKLTLEITESIFTNDFDLILPILNQIRGYGIKISLDDFGTGYSSLSMLKNLPIDELKIDKSFIDFIAKDKKDKKLVGSILDIAENLGMKVVAEGVEDEQQSMILKTYHCDFQQGYYFSKPLFADDLQAFIEKH
jgi:diguanylate cyclase (GGDEF)-like protein